MRSTALPPLLYHRQPTTLVEMLRMRAGYHPDRTLYVYLTDGEEQQARYTYAELDAQARRVAAWLQAHHLQGERALLLFPPGLDFIAAYMGCLYAGVVAVPSYPPRLNRPSPRIQTIVADSRSAVVLTTGEIYNSMEQRFEYTPDLKVLQWLDTATLAPGLEDSWKDPQITGDTLAFLQYTSGSTSEPKGVMVTHANLMHNLQMIRQGFWMLEEDDGVIWLPNYHDMGLIGGILTPLYVGGKSVLMSPLFFLQRPLRWLQAIHRNHCAVSGGPNFAYDLCVDKTTPEQRAELDLSCWHTAFSGAEPIRVETLRRFSEAFAVSGFKSSAFYPCYGLAEGTLIVSGGDGPAEPEIYHFSRSALAQDRIAPAEADGPDAQAFVACGHALLEEKIAIVNPETCELCAPNEIGEIWTQSGSVAQGYWENPAETQRVFQAQILGAESNGFYMRTGDLGFMVDDQLFVAGRRKDLIIIRGTNHYPQDIELTVEQSHPALQTSGGAAFSVQVQNEEQLVVVQELTRTGRNADQTEIFRAIRRAISENHELQVYAIVLLRPLTVPKTSSGKIQRYACKLGFLEGSLEAMGEWRAPLKPVGRA